MGRWCRNHLSTFHCLVLLLIHCFCSEGPSHQIGGAIVILLRLLSQPFKWDFDPPRCTCVLLRIHYWTMSCVYFHGGDVAFFVGVFIPYDLCRWKSRSIPYDLYRWKSHSISYDLCRWKSRSSPRVLHIIPGEDDVGIIGLFPRPLTPFQSATPHCNLWYGVTGLVGELLKWDCVYFGGVGRGRKEWWRRRSMSVSVSVSELICEVCSYEQVHNQECNWVTSELWCGSM